MLWWQHDVDEQDDGMENDDDVWRIEKNDVDLPLIQKLKRNLS